MLVHSSFLKQNQNQAFAYELESIKLLDQLEGWELEKGCINALIGFAYFKLFLELE